MQPVTRPVLQPGVHVVSRGRDRLQVGLADGLARVLPDDGTGRTVRALLDPTSPSPGAAQAPGAAVTEALADLDRAGLIEDATLGGDRRAARTAARVEVRGSLGVSPRALLESFGVRATTSPATAPDAVLLLSVGELDRARLDPLVRAQVPHLLVRAFDGQVELGPFVDPGRTACLSCLDAHRADADPEHPAVVDRYVRAGAADGPDLVDPALATVATAWAVRDLVTWLDGGTPSSWSTTLTFGRRLGAFTSVSWLRHPACGCAW